jgi:mannosyl-oligosaccharide alpha-1,2-mannosidase
LLTGRSRYFLFHATLIPIHCLRHNPHHVLAGDWRARIRSSLAIMDAMTELSPNSGKCREISLKLCWPHLQDDRDATLYGGGDGEQAAEAFIPSLGDAEAASMLNGYDAWCGLMRGNGGGVPLYQWPNVDDQDLDIFYGAGGGHLP